MLRQHNGPSNDRNEPVATNAATRLDVCISGLHVAYERAAN